MQSFMILKWHQIRSLISILPVIDKYRFIQRTCLIVSTPFGNYDYHYIVIPFEHDFFFSETMIQEDNI